MSSEKRISHTPISVADPQRGYRFFQGQIDAAVARVFQSGRYILGSEVSLFEQEFAHYLGSCHAIGVASGTDALRVALMALDIGSDDEVITVANAGDPTPMAIWSVGAIPRLVDVDLTTRTMSVEQAKKAIGPRTKAILPVHLYGLPANIDALSQLARSAGLRLIEDACQAHGAKYNGRYVGTFGDFGCFSFYPTKNLGAFGDGGMVVTNDKQLAERAQLIREYGWRPRGHSLVRGIGSRLDELQAAILRVKLPHLDRDTGRRREIAAIYREGLVGTAERLALPAEFPDREHVFHLYVVRSPIRDKLRSRLAAKGIGTGVHYPVPTHLQPAFQGFWNPNPSLPITEQLAVEVLTLPMFPGLTNAELARIIDAVRDSSSLSCP